MPFGEEPKLSSPANAYPPSFVCVTDEIPPSPFWEKIVEVWFHSIPDVEELEVDVTVSVEKKDVIGLDVGVEIGVAVGEVDG